MSFPRIHLAIDNCFASKRWTEPREWMELVRTLGVKYIEASADTEADPIYMGARYMERWVREVARCEKSTGVRVVNLYSGHGTYATLGLGHTDSGVRARIRDSWVKPMLSAAASLGAGLGFFCHAFPDFTLQNPARYADAVQNLYNELARVSEFAEEYGVQTVAVEQMYSPHQIPWTLDGAIEFLSRMKETKRTPLYITIDTGHQTGQKRFRLPSRADVARAVAAAAANRPIGDLWLGPRSAYELLAGAKNSPATAGAVVSKILKEVRRHPFLFAKVQDWDLYAWVRRVGCYSPIVHLQQVVDGSSAHMPFTEETNKKGIVRGEALLDALASCYRRSEMPSMPPRCADIYLTLEIFSGTAETPTEILSKIRESVRYWRRYIPEDGISLRSLLSHCQRVAPSGMTRESATFFA